MISIALCWVVYLALYPLAERLRAALNRSKT